MTETTVHSLSAQPVDEGCGILAWFLEFFSVRSWRLRRRLATLRQHRLEVEQDLARKLSTKLGKGRPRR